MEPKPFTVIGGFLGAGKTTLLNNILRSSLGIRFAVLVNDFGDINIDAGLIESHDGKTMALSNGCICCSIANGFITAMIELMRSPDLFDHIVIEASGVSEPDRIMDFARIDRELMPDGIVVLVDAANFLDRHGDPKLTQVLTSQLNSADLLIINKADLIDADDLAEFQETLGQIAGETPQLIATNAIVPLEFVLGMDHQPRPDPGCAHFHAEQIFETVTIKLPDPINRGDFEAFADTLPPFVLRGKGHVPLAEGVHFWQKVGSSSMLTFVGFEREADNQIVLIGTEPLNQIVETVNELLAA